MMCVNPTIEDAKDATIARRGELLRRAKEILETLNSFVPAEGTTRIIARIEAELEGK